MATLVPIAGLCDRCASDPPATAKYLVLNDEDEIVGRACGSHATGALDAAERAEAKKKQPALPEDGPPPLEESKSEEAKS